MGSADHVSARGVDDAPLVNRSLRADTRGVASVEYIIVLCLLGMAVFSAWRSFGETVRSRVSSSEMILRELEGGGASGLSPFGAAASAAGVGGVSGATGEDGGSGFWGNLGGFAVGFGEGVWDAARGTVVGIWDLGTAIVGGAYDAVTDPRGTWDSVSGAVRGAIDDPGGTAGRLWDTTRAIGSGIWAAGANAVSTIRDGSWEDRGHVTGRVASEIALAFVPASKVGLLGRGARAAEEAEEIVTVYRGIRVAEGAEVQGMYRAANGGQMVSTEASHAIHYGLRPAGAVPGGIQNADEVVLMRFGVRDSDILYDPYGNAEGARHVVLRPDVDVTSQPGYREVRVPAAELENEEIQNAALDALTTNKELPVRRRYGR